MEARRTIICMFFWASFTLGIRKYEDRYCKERKENTFLRCSDGSRPLKDLIPQYQSHVHPYRKLYGDNLPSVPEKYERK